MKRSANVINLTSGKEKVARTEVNLQAMSDQELRALLRRLIQKRDS